MKKYREAYAKKKQVSECSTLKEHERGRSEFKERNNYSLEFSPALIDKAPIAIAPDQEKDILLKFLSSRGVSPEQLCK